MQRVGTFSLPKSPSLTRTAATTPRRSNAALQSFTAASAAATLTALTACVGVRLRACKKPRVLSGRRGAEVVQVAAASNRYEVVPREGCAFGASVRGFSVKDALDDAAVMEQIRSDMYKYRLLIFHGQTDLMPEDHIKLSEHLGSLEHILHRPHPKSPDPRLLRVANDDREGFMSVGTSGWHVDGVMLQAPFAAQTMHHLHAIPDGDTLFLGLNELLESMDEDLRDLCERLWFVSGVGEDLQQGEGQMSLLPLVYKHPFTGVKTMCFHLGQTYCLGFVEEQPLNAMLEAFANVMTRGDKLVNDARSSLQRVLAGPDDNCPSQFRFLPALPVQDCLQKAIDGMDPETRSQSILRVEWDRGDLALIDNMGLAHLPAPGTQSLPLISGLRVFHRTTMVNPEAEVRSLRGAQSVLLGGKRREGPISDEAVTDPEAMRDILRALMAATPINPDELGGDQRGGDLQISKNVPAREEALRALEEAEQPLDMLKAVDEELQTATNQGKEALTKALKRLMMEYHPDPWIVQVIGALIPFLWGSSRSPPYQPLQKQ